MKMSGNEQDEILCLRPAQEMIPNGCFRPVPGVFHLLSVDAGFVPLGQWKIEIAPFESPTWTDQSSRRQGHCQPSFNVLAAGHEEHTPQIPPPFPPKAPT